MFGILSFRVVSEEYREQCCKSRVQLERRHCFCETTGNIFSRTCARRFERKILGVDMNQMHRRMTP